MELHNQEFPKANDVVEEMVELEQSALAAIAGGCGETIVG